MTTLAIITAFITATVFGIGFYHVSWLVSDSVENNVIPFITAGIVSPVAVTFLSFLAYTLIADADRAQMLRAGAVHAAAAVVITCAVLVLTAICEPGQYSDT